MHLHHDRCPPGDFAGERIVVGKEMFEPNAGRA